MNIRLNNLERLLKLKENNNQKSRINYLNDAYDNIQVLIMGLFNASAFIFTIVTFLLIIFSDINKKPIVLILALFSIVMSWLIVSFIIKAAIYDAAKNIFDEDIQKFNNQLNNVYVDPNNEEKVYLLHELIKKHGFKSNEHENQENDNIILFKLNSDVEYKQFKNMEFSNKQIRNVLLKNVIPFKELSNKQCELFFFEYIRPYLTNKKMAFDEKEEMLKRVTDLNDVKL